MKTIILMIAFSASDMGVESAIPTKVYSNMMECQNEADRINIERKTQYAFCIYC